MIFYTEEQLASLRASVGMRMSEYRFNHTLGVEKMASRLAKACLPEAESALRAAALLHDIAKESDVSTLVSAIKDDGFSLTREDMQSGAILHSFASPYFIKRDFPDFATGEILSACRNHTVGAPDMSVFDMIIFISDFIEDGRRYESSLIVRASLLSSLYEGNIKENQKALLLACVSSLSLTEEHLKKTGRMINSRMILTKNALLGK